MKTRGSLKHYLMIILMQFALISCVSAPNPTSTPLPTEIKPMVEPTLTATPIVYHTETPIPTPTLRAYTIQTNDTIIGIGKKFVLTPEAITQVNPGINPGGLVVGSQIFLPSDIADTSAYFITPVPLTIGVPFCFQQFNLLRCLVEVSNSSEQIAENISIDFFLIGTQGELLEKISVPILANTLYPNETIPAIGTFEIMDDYNSVQATLSGATYNPASNYQRNSPLVNVSSLTRWDGKLAEIDGKIDPSFGGSAWIIALGWNKQGTLTAAQKWEWNAGVPLTRQEIDFGLVPFAGEINKVTLIIETWE